MSDLSPLKECPNLEMLFAQLNTITDAAPLGALQNLTMLWLSFNELEDVACLQGLHSLQAISLNGNKFSPAVWEQVQAQFTSQIQEDTSDYEANGRDET